MDPFQIILKECWEKVFEKIEDPQEILNLLRTNSNLNEAFHEQKAALLFPGVLSVLLKATEKTVNSDASLKQAFLECRLVSVRCAKVIDNYAEHYWDTRYMPPPFILRSGNFRSGEGLVRFLQQIENHPSHRTPLLSRLVNTCSIHSDMNDEQPKQEDILQLMKKTGKHLRAFSIYAIVGDDGQRSSNMAKEMVSFAPNLRRLTIYLNAQDRSADDEVGEVNVKEDVLEFPSFSSLACLEILCDAATSVVNRFNFKQSFGHVSFLALNFALWKDEYLEQGLFPNLKRATFYGIDLLGTDVEEKLMKIFRYLDAPKLDELPLWITERNENQQQTSLIEALFSAVGVSSFDNQMDRLKNNGLEEIQKRFGDSQWKAAIGSGTTRHFGGAPAKQLKFEKVVETEAK